MEEVATSPDTAEPRAGGPAAYRPSGVPLSHWEKFQQLKARRAQECDEDTSGRIAAERSRALRNVSKQLSARDKSALRREGVALPRTREKRKRRNKLSSEQESCSSKPHWDEVQKYMEPNPHLSGAVDQCRPKCGLEERMDLAVDGGDYERAVRMNDQLAQRELGVRVARAFDCHKYVKDMEAKNQQKKAKRPKLKWRFEHKQRWETKGNM